MSVYFDDGQVTMHLGEVREVLRAMPAESVHCVVTSPPYWSLRDYGVSSTIWPAQAAGLCSGEHRWGAETRQDERYTGKVKWQHIGEEAQAAGVKVRDVDPNAWGHPKVSDTATCCACGAWRGALGLEPTPELFVAHTVEVFREVRRVLRKDGTLWLNIGDSYAASRSGAIGELSTLDGGHGPPSAYRESYANARWSGRSHTRERFPALGIKPKDLVGIPWMLAFALRADGWWLRQDIIWSKSNPMPESVRDRCTKAHEYLFLLTKAERYYSDFRAIREAATGAERDQIEARSQRVAASNKSNPTKKVNGIRSKRNSFARETSVPLVPGAHTKQHRPGRDDIAYEGTRNKRSVWSIPTAPYAKAHFATFPPALVEPCVRAGSPAGGVVLDPFLGSGTTAMVARQNGRRAVGIDLNPDYLAMAIGRVGAQMALMGGAAAG